MNFLKKNICKAHENPIFTQYLLYKIGNLPMTVVYSQYIVIKVLPQVLISKTW